MNTLTMVEIIEETVKFYDDDVERRSLLPEGCTGMGCSYSDRRGQHCAVGRCLTEKALDDDPDQHTDANVDGVWGGMESLDPDLKPEYRGHCMKFWSRLQHLHDCAAFWNSKGITVEGKRESLSMMSKFMR